MKKKFNIDWNQAEIHKVGSRGKKPSIVVGKSGGVRMNPSFVREYNIKNTKYLRAMIGSSGDRFIVGFRLLKERGPDTFALAFDKKVGSATFSGRSLFNKLKLDLEKVTPLNLDFEFQEFQGDKVLVVEIPKLNHTHQ